MEKVWKDMTQRHVKPDIVPHLIPSTTGTEHQTHNSHSMDGNSSANKNTASEDVSGRTTNVFHRATNVQGPKGSDK